MVGTRRLTQLVESVEDRLALPEGPLVVAMSGGADSAALAFLAGQQGREVRAVHIDHGLPGSPLMRKAAKEVAAVTGLELDVRTIEVPEGPSPEGQARLARYAELAIATSTDESLLTAHTRDDNVETVLFNLIRGTGPRGLAGIPYRRAPNVVRPILEVTRSETRELAYLSSLPYVDDPMNEDPSVSRTAIRTRVVPMLAELNPRLGDSVARLGAAIGSDNELLDRKGVARSVG